MAGLLSVGLAACSLSPRSPADRARDVAEQWIAAAKAGDDDAASDLACADVDPRMGVNSDSGGFTSYTLELQDRGEGIFYARYTLDYPDSEDSPGVLTVRTEGRTCIEASQ
ncbi:hypothetical protein [Microbacterium sp. NPDC057650]|uniref:hypothetical protein n=1 Tax=unclassified Microbacterium TaxID=2609290 RepID=UPI0036705556